MPIEPYLIALFPNEIMCCPRSKYLRSCSHDVPWDEPELVCTVLNTALRPRVSRRLRTILERISRRQYLRLLSSGLLNSRRDR